MKKILFITAFLVVSLSSVASARDFNYPPPKGATVFSIECEIKPSKAEYHIGDMLEFDYVCSSPDQDEFIVPNQLISYPLKFAEGIHIEGEDGKKYQFIKVPDIHKAFFAEDTTFINKDTVHTFKFPGCCGYETLLIESDLWIDTWNPKESFTSLEKYAKFDAGFKTLPPGKYSVWFDMSKTWQTYKGDKRSFLVDDIKSLKDINSYLWWQMRGNGQRHSFVMKAE